MKKRFFSILLMITMVMSMITISSTKAVYAAGLTISYDGADNSHKISAADHYNSTTELCGPIRPWNVIITGGDDKHYSGSLDLYANHGNTDKFLAVKFVQESAIAGISLGESHLVNTSTGNGYGGTKVTITIINKTAQEIQNYINENLKIQFKISLTNYNSYKDIMDIAFKLVKDGNLNEFTEQTVATATISSAKDSDLPITINNSKGDQIDQTIYIRLSNATVNTNITNGTNLDSWCTNLPEGLSLIADGPTASGSNVIKCKLTGSATKVYNSTTKPTLTIPATTITPNTNCIIDSSGIKVSMDNLSITIVENPNILEAKEFIDENLKDNNGIITTVNDNNYQIILDSKEKYNALKTEVKSEINNQLNSIQSGLTYDSLLLNAEKEKAKKDIQDKVNNFINTINNLDISNDLKEQLKTKARTDGTTACSNIDSATTENDINSIVTNFSTGTNNASNKISEIINYANAAKNVINNLSYLSDEEKNSYIDKLNTDLSEKVLLISTDSSKIDEAVTKFKSNADLIQEKAETLNTIQEYANKKITEITNLGLPNEQINNLKDAINVYVNEAKVSIDNSNASTDMSAIINDTKRKIVDTFDQAKAIHFVNNYLSDNNYKNIYLGVTRENIERIISGKEEWKILTESQKRKVESIISNQTNLYHTYTDYLNEANSFCEKNSNEFITKHMKDNNDKIVTAVSKDTLDMILGGEDDFNALSNPEKDAINKKLNVAGATQTYEQMLEKAKNLANTNTNASKFIKENLTKDGNVITTVSKDTLDQILKAEDNYKNLSQAEKDAINKELSQKAGTPTTYEEMLEKAKAMLNETSHEFIANHMTDNNDKIVTAVTKDTLDMILGGEDDFNALTDVQKDTVNEKLKAAGATQTYQEMLIAAKSMLSTTSDGFITAHMTDKNDKTVTAVTKDTLDMILGGEDDFNALTDAQKDAVNEKLNVAGATQTYQEMLEKAKNLANTNASKFIEDNLTKDGNVITTVSKDTLDQILKAEDNYKDLSQAEKDAINKELSQKAGTLTTYEKMLEEAKAMLNETSNEFIANHMTDNNDKTVTAVTKDTLDMILGGEDDFNALTDAQKDAVNEKLNVVGATQTYQEMLKEAKAMLNETSNKFIANHMTDKNDKTVTAVTKDTLDMILGGEDDFNALTDAQKDAVNEKLNVAGATQTYQEMLKEAKNLANTNASKFIKENLTKDGNVITTVSKDTLDQILKAEDNYKNLSQAEKDAINKELSQKAGTPTTYEEMLEEAKAMLNETSNKFIANHMTDKNDKIVTAVTKDTLDMILGGEDDFNALTDVQKDTVNEKLKAAGATQTYQEMLIAAKSIVKENANDFIEKYISDKNKNIYSKATETNYKQILSGLDIWNQFSQSEKDAINAILLNSGSQKYEDLVLQANKIKSLITKTSDDTNIFAYIAGISICGFVILYELKKRQQINS